MIFFIVRVVITTIVVLIGAHSLPGLEVKNNFDAILFGIILAIINSSIRPILTLLTLPITIFTLGLFLLVINGFTFWLASELSYGVHISTFWGAFWGGFIIWITGIFTNRLIWSSNTY
ncbi:MAG: phage holin family protein [Simkaniaceae bacterium]|nr:phage holin family protein [Simkaniaceae bacterium]